MVALSGGLPSIELRGTSGGSASISAGVRSRRWTRTLRSSVCSVTGDGSTACNWAVVGRGTKTRAE